MFRYYSIILTIFGYCSVAMGQGTYLNELKGPVPDPVIKKCLTAGDCISYSRESTTKGDHKNSLTYMEIAAHMGSGEAQYQLAKLYEGDIFKRIAYQLGEVVDEYGNFIYELPDKPRSYLWYRIAALNGSVKASERLEQSTEEEFKPLRPYAVRTSIELEIGEYFEGGSVLPQSYENARKHYEMAIENGWPAAYSKLARLYQFGLGVPQNHKKAREFYSNNFNTGKWVPPEAYYDYAKMLEGGFGGPVDLVRAYVWMTIATDMDPYAQAQLELIKAKLTQTQLAEAKNILDEEYY